MTPFAKAQHWAGAALLGAIVAGLLFGTAYPHYWVAFCGALTSIILFEPLRRWAVKQKQLADAKTERIEELEDLDRQAASYVESVIALRTHFTGDPPYVGWEGLGLALNETLDILDMFKKSLEEIRDLSAPGPSGGAPADVQQIRSLVLKTLRQAEAMRSLQHVGRYPEESLS